MPTVTDPSAEDFTTAITESPALNTGGTGSRSCSNKVGKKLEIMHSICIDCRDSDLET